MVLIIQCDSRVPAGIYGMHLKERKIPHSTVRLFAGDLPPEPSGNRAVLVLGGYMGVHEEARYPFLSPLKAFLGRAAFTKVPILGICLGGQLLAAALGGEVRSGCRGEKGLQPVELTPEGLKDPLFAGLPPSFFAFQWHNDSFDLPPGTVHLARSAACPGQAFRFRNACGLQFHPEVDREIVAAWSAAADPQGTHLENFTRGEAEHRRIALRLFDNFLEGARAGDMEGGGCAQ